MLGMLLTGTTGEATLLLSGSAWRPFPVGGLAVAEEGAPRPHTTEVAGVAVVGATPDTIVVSGGTRLLPP